MPEAASTGGAGLAEEEKVTALETEILSQPDVVRIAITENLEQLRAATALVSAARRIRLTGSGSDYQAAAAGSWMFRDVGISAVASRAYDLANYPTNFEPGDLLLVISHTEPDASIKTSRLRAGSSGLKTIGLTSRDTSLDADVVIPSFHKQESLTPSVSSTTAMAVIAAIAARFEPRSLLASAVPTLPESLRSMMKSREIAREVASQIAENDSRIMIAGSGGLLSAARTGAFMLKIAARVVAEGLHSDDAVLGGLFGFNANDVVIQIAPDGLHNDLRQIAEQFALTRWQIGGPASNATWHTRLPDVPGVITPIHALIPLQWLALETAIVLDQNPDTFRSSDPGLVNSLS